MKMTRTQREATDVLTWKFLKEAEVLLQITEERMALIEAILAPMTTQRKLELLRERRMLTDRRNRLNAGIAKARA